MRLNISSDLRKPGLVQGESLSSTHIISSVLEKSQIYIMSNRKSLHMQTKQCFWYLCTPNFHPNMLIRKPWVQNEVKDIPKAMFRWPRFQNLRRR